MNFIKYDVQIEEKENSSEIEDIFFFTEVGKSDEKFKKEIRDRLNVKGILRYSDSSGDLELKFMDNGSCIKQFKLKINLPIILNYIKKTKEMILLEQNEKDNYIAFYTIKLEITPL